MLGRGRACSSALRGATSSSHSRRTCHKRKASPPTPGRVSAEGDPNVGRQKQGGDRSQCREVAGRRKVQGRKTRQTVPLGLGVEQPIGAFGVRDGCWDEGRMFSERPTRATRSLWVQGRVRFCSQTVPLGLGVHSGSCRGGRTRVWIRAGWAHRAPREPDGAKVVAELARLRALPLTHLPY
eukprot:7383279-Prymnesium_polylepis.3